MDAKKAAHLLWGHIFKDRDRNPKMDKVEFLRTVTFFKSLSKWQLQAISEIIHERTYEVDEYLFEIDQPGSALFIIKSGKISIEIPKQVGDPTQVAVLSEGHFLGELALLDQSPRSASARAMTRAQCLAFFRNDLTTLMQTHPDIAGQIFRSLAVVIGERLRETTATLKMEEGARS